MKLLEEINEKKAMHNYSTFAFTEVTVTEVREEISSLITKTPNLANSITSKQLKDHINICSHFCMK